MILRTMHQVESLILSHNNETAKARSVTVLAIVYNTGIYADVKIAENVKKRVQHTAKNAA